MTLAPRVAAIHDLSALGRCSMTVILPVLSTMGVQCCPLLTASLSAHTGFPASSGGVILDLTAQMEGTAAHWEKLGITFDAIYSGFLISEAQAETVLSFFRRFRRSDTLVLADPVMGDHGKPYRTCTPALRRAVAELAEQADVITPNLTEAALLLGEDYSSAPRTWAEAQEWMHRLSLRGRRSVVLTGVSFAEGQVGAACLDTPGGQASFAMAKREPVQFPGTGDLFASILLGGLLCGETLDAANRRAVQFVQQCAAHTIALGTPPAEGVQFEPLLKEFIRTIP